MLPSWLLWLLPVLLAPVLAVAWASWTGRTRGPAAPERTVAEHQRFREALSRTAARRPDPAPSVPPSRSSPQQRPARQR